MIYLWMIAIAVFLALCIWSAFSLSVWREAKKSENIRRENENMRRHYFMQEGMPVNARVRDVVLHEDRKQYEIIASWRSRETGRVFYFHEICMFPVDAAPGFQPNIERGSIITAWIILDQPAIFIDQNW
ncbi:MAG TPA: hypothetical protein VF026_09315 [Ktedonobacteraceae bacterium]